MERRDFFKQCGAAGASCLGLSLLISSCRGPQNVTGTVNKNKVEISKSEFIIQKNDKVVFRKYITVRPAGIDYPIVVYRFSESDYKALLLSCTHQGNELNVSGDLISCPAHNSEFNNKGEVLQGPAETSLQSFPVSSDEKNIYIQLS